MSRNSDSSLVELLIYVVLLVVIFIWEVGAGLMASPEEAIKAAKDLNGFSEVTVTDKAIMFIS